jgi:Holliday junction resolvase
MANTPEKKVKDKVRKVLAGVNAYVVTPATHGYGVSGVPDILVCYHGRFLAIECKAGNNHPTALQIRNLSQIASTGGYTLVVNEDNIDDVEDVLARIDRDRGYAKG